MKASLVELFFVADKRGQRADKGQTERDNYGIWIDETRTILKETQPVSLLVGSSDILRHVGLKCSHEEVLYLPQSTSISNSK